MTDILTDIATTLINAITGNIVDIHIIIGDHIISEIPIIICIIIIIQQMYIITIGKNKFSVFNTLN